MHRNFFNLHPFYAPEDSGAGPGTATIPRGKVEVADDDTALLDALLDGKDNDAGDDDSDDSGDKDDDKDNNKDDDSQDDLIVDDDSKIGDDTDDIDLDANSRNVNFKEVKEKYGDFAKTEAFKQLRDSYYREGEFTKLFPTIDDAKEAAENNETFIKMNESLVRQGDPIPLLVSLKQASPESLKKVATGFLDSLNRIDPALHIQVITPVIKRLARSMYTTAQKTLRGKPENEDAQALAATARNIMQYAFEDAELVEKDDDGSRRDPAIEQKEKEINNRETALRVERFNGAYSTVATSIEHHLDNEIAKGLDPDGRFNEFTRNTLVEKIKNDVQSQINKDENHIRRMNSIWKRAESSGYNRENLSRLVAAYLERARSIIPASRNRFRSIALKNNNSGRNSDNSSGNNTGRNLRIANRGTTGRAPERDGRVKIGSVDPRKIDYSKTSDLDILNGKVNLKGKG